MIDYDRYLAIPDPLDRAIAFASDAHVRVDQRRKYTNAPYFEHPLAVMEIVRSRPHTVAMLIAAVLHDTVEDTDVTLIDILFLFGMMVARLVSDLTDVSKPSDGNYLARKAIDRNHTAQALNDAKSVKCADCIHNGHDIVANDKDFAVPFLREMRKLSNGPLDGADPVLLADVKDLVATNLDRLEAITSADKAARRAAHQAQCLADKARKRGIKGLAPQASQQA